MSRVRKASASIALLVSLTGVTSAQTGAPPDWAATVSKAKQFIFDGRHKDAIALLEPVVDTYPRFADGHLWIGIVYESMGREQVRSDKMAALKALDTAAMHYQHGFELGGGGDPEHIVRGLVDLLGLLGRGEDRRKTIAAAVTRYPALPAAHWYTVELAFHDDTDIGVPLRAARAGIPQANTSARLDYAGYLAALVDKAPLSAKATLVTEVTALCDEAARMRPSNPRVTAQVEGIKSRLAIASTPVDTTRGPRADEAGVTSDLRAIVTAQMVYSAVCSTGFFAPTLETLARPPRGSTSVMLSPDLVPSGGSTVLERYGYRIEMTASRAPKSPASCNGVGAGGSATVFSVTARPLPGRSGRSYQIDQNGTLTTIQ